MLIVNICLFSIIQMLIAYVACANEKTHFVTVARPQLTHIETLANSALKEIQQSQVPQQARVLLHNYYTQLNKTQSNKPVLNHSMAEVNFRAFQGSAKIEVGSVDSGQVKGQAYKLSSLQHYPKEVHLISQLIFEEFKKNSSLREVVLASLENENGMILTAEKLAIEFVSRRDHLSSAEKEAIAKYFMQDFQRQEANLKLLIQMTKDSERKKILLAKFFQVCRLEAPLNAKPSMRLSLVKMGRGQISSLFLGTVSAVLAKKAFVGQGQSNTHSASVYPAISQPMVQNTAK